MHRQGNSPEMIARAFGKSARHIARRLRLADPPDPVLDTLAAGGISIDVAQALTLAGTPAQAEDACESARARGLSADAVRRSLMEGNVPLSPWCCNWSRRSHSAKPRPCSTLA